MRNKRKTAFTLLEIILVIAILGLIASVVGWQIASCVNRYAFQSEVEEIYKAVKQSQLLSLVYKTDIDVRFFREDGVFYYCLQTDEPFAEIHFDREKKALSKIGQITWNGQPVKHFDISIVSHGATRPQGILGFYPQNKKEDNALWFDMQGAFLISLSHQKPIKFKERAPVFPKDQLNKFHTKKQEPKSEVQANIPESTIPNPTMK